MKINITLDDISTLRSKLETLAGRWANIRVDERTDSIGAICTSLVISPHCDTAASIQINLESDFGANLTFGSHTDIEVPFPIGYKTGLPWDQEVLALCDAVIGFGMVEETAFQKERAVGGRFTITLRSGKVIRGGWVWRLPLALRFRKRIETIHYTAYFD